MRLDKTVARLWMTTYDDLTKKVKTLRTELKALNQEASRTTSAINGVSTGANASTTSTANATNAAITQTSNLVRGTGGAPSAGGGAAGAAGAAGAIGGGGGGGAGAALSMAGPYGAMASAAASVIKSQMDKVQQQLAKMDARIDRGYTPALAADRQSVMYQQMYGVTQQQNYNQYRQPLNNYRLGDGGINQMLSLQASTGLNAQTMAPGVEAIRTISGFSLGTGDVTGMLQSLASPEVNNRLTMTLGTGLYGLGGKQRTPMEVIQKIVRGAGLTDARVAETALQPGSTTRARLTAMGVPPEMHDTIIQYAMQNAQFQKKTGGKKGMYNPGDRAQLKTMGISGNFATEREVSDVRRTQTDESFYNKQKDNFASMERNTQKMESLTRRIEELTSAITGARISTRGNPITKGIGKMFGTAMGPINDLLGMFGGDPVES
jgi:prefoldin subunit 5